MGHGLTSAFTQASTLLLPKVCQYADKCLLLMLLGKSKTDCRLCIKYPPTVSRPQKHVTTGKWQLTPSWCRSTGAKVDIAEKQGYCVSRSCTIKRQTDRLNQTQLTLVLQAVRLPLAKHSCKARAICPRLGQSFRHMAHKGSWMQQPLVQIECQLGLGDRTMISTALVEGPVGSPSHLSRFCNQPQCVAYMPKLIALC